MSHISSELFTQILNLDSQWEVYQTQYVADENTIFIRIRETAELFKQQRCRTARISDAK